MTTKKPANVKRHLLFIGFSCTGKTSLGRKVFDARVIDSDDQILTWISVAGGGEFDNIYKLYITHGRKAAIEWITKAEEALIGIWSDNANPMIISLGPGFPLRNNWSQLRVVSHVVLFRRSPENIYQSFIDRREGTPEKKGIFQVCPDAKNFDSWDVGVIVDEQRRKYFRDEAIENIKRIVAERENFYGDHDLEIRTDELDAIAKLKEIKLKFEAGSL
jgi:shikimate kinase